MTRRVLDDRLVGAACAAGALFEPSTAVRAPLVDGADRISGVRIAARVATPLRSRVVIAADGRASKLGRMLGLSAPAQSPRRWAFGAYFENVSAMSTRGEMHVRCGAYIGIAPVPSGLSNVCLVRDVNRLRQAARYGAGDVIEQSVKTDHALRGRFAHAKRVSPVVVLGPLAVRGLAAGCPGLLLAGDAAGFVDPMTGDGLRFAIRGGELAAHAALRELDSGMPAYLELARERRREFARKWQVNRLLRGLVASPFSLRVAAAVARQWDAPFSWLVDFAGDVPLARAAATAGAPVP